MATIDIKLKRVSKIYTEGDTVAGIVFVDSRGAISHQGLTLTMDGSVHMQLSSKTTGGFDAFYNSIKPIQLVLTQLELAKPGRFPSGRTEIPFEIPLKSKAHKTLYETYHGVFINIQYFLKTELKRGLLNKDVQKQAEFLVEYKNDADLPSTANLPVKPVQFSMSEASVTNVTEKSFVPRFSVRGHLDTCVIPMARPVSGELTVESCGVGAIKSVELQLVRVETCGCAEGYARDPTEIQNIQVCDGDVARARAIPLHMQLPRLFTCPSVAATNFKIEFEMNLVVVFTNDDIVSENIPITITRH